MCSLVFLFLSGKYFLATKPLSHKVAQRDYSINILNLTILIYNLETDLLLCSVSAP